jgi:hypothetical protein
VWSRERYNGGYETLSWAAMTRVIVPLCERQYCLHPTSHLLPTSARANARGRWRFLPQYDAVTNMR